MKKVVLVLIGALTLFSCSSSLDKKYNEETAKEDFKLVTEEVSYEEANLITSEMVRAVLKGESIEGKTYGEILDSAKEFKKAEELAQKEAEELAAKTLKEEQERTLKLNKSAIVTCFKKGYFEYDYSDYISYSFAIENKSDKNIRAIKGTIIFNNLFDDEVKKLNLVYDDKIVLAGERNVYEATTEYNQFKDSDVLLKSKDLKDLKVIWKPEKIIFEDGAVLE